MEKEDQPDWLKPVPKTPLSKVVVEKIKSAMIDGKLKPGDYLPSENELVSSLGVGKSSVREAIKMLEALGVVEICKGKGSRIRASADGDVIEPMIFQLIMQSSDNREALVEFRLMFETSASLVAIQHATEEDLILLRELYHKMERDFAAGERSPENDISFHLAVYNCTHNPFIAHIGNTVISLFRPSLEISNRDYPQDVLSDHRRILDALKARDKEKMKRAIEKSLKLWDRLALHPKTHP
jgi:GntR family transcriptional repressor for pyruvate dehydrogenase complex